MLCHLLILSLTFSKISFENTIRVSNSLDPEEARHFVGPDLDQNCFPRLSADDTSRQQDIEDIRASQDERNGIFIPKL